MSSEFVLHERLAADTVEIDRWDLSLVRLMNARDWPWLILVPARPSLREIHDLSPADRALLVEEVARAGRLLERRFRPDKINVAALGNLVPQLHVHVIARFRTDPAWPRPVWGPEPPARCAPGDLERRVAEIGAALG